LVGTAGVVLWVLLVPVPWREVMFGPLEVEV
jgi:hypothetical protein